MTSMEIVLGVAVVIAGVVGFVFGQRSGSSDASALRARLEERDRAHADSLAQLQSARQELTDRFKALADQILDEKRRAFVEQNQQSLGELLTPLRTELDGFRKQVDESNRATTTRHGELTEQLRQLRDLNTQLGTETQQLTKALKGDTKQQGDWGEHVLEQILEHAGLQREVHFLVQPSYDAAEGGRLRPDVVIHMPGDRYLVVDSKVSLTAYAEVPGAVDDAALEAQLKKHVESVRSHVRALGDKAYPKLIGNRSPDFTVMFLPLEGAFLAALRADPELTRFAWDRNVILVSPSTLLFVVRCVVQLWDTEKQTKNAQDISERGAALYDKFRGFVEDLEAMGKQLDAARASYDSAFQKLSLGRGNLVRQADMLRELGVQPKKALPADLVERARDSEVVAALAPSDPY